MKNIEIAIERVERGMRERESFKDREMIKQRIIRLDSKNTKTSMNV